MIQVSDAATAYPDPQGWELPAVLVLVGLLVLADMGPAVVALLQAWWRHE